MPGFEHIYDRDQSRCSQKEQNYQAGKRIIIYQKKSIIF
ncbi:hypothetical protein UUU_26700 (plasmid) [Klebsiella pneumoniae subsp. pneumoniae DSM 30104 = JCM 1662 = NBRC 14940]|nr:hypothetical protein UUU_26700 [Klebsiella pneumoniae subsp. pneumoniae DSM 30104 = JCM 1662 = NBRC 14940]